MTHDLHLNENKSIISENMVKVSPNENHTYYLDGILKDNLDTTKREVIKKDYDAHIIFDGQERMGKTTMAGQVAMYLNPNMSIDNVAFNIFEYIQYYEKAKKGDCIMFDETMAYLGARNSLSWFNRLLIKVFSEMGSKNLFSIICIPSFFELDKYPAIHRSILLFHIHKRSFFWAYNYNRKKLLYLNGKRFYSYANPSPNWTGRFVKYFVFDKQAYELKKQKGISNFNQLKNNELQLMTQRDALICYTFENKLLNMDKLTKITGLTSRRIYKIVENAQNPTRMEDIGLMG